MTTRTQETRQERNARYSREYRARKRAEAAERARVASDGPAGVMRQSVEGAIAGMKWLAASDAASVAQVRALADMVDQAVTLGDSSLALRAHSLLSRLLAEVGGTPKVRMQLELRARRVEQGAESAAVAAAPNVTPITSKRPPKRAR